MNVIKFSIIIPIYNVEKYLNKCVESVLNQTYPNIEVILVDDGSTDNSGKICDEYAQKDTRIKVIHKENGGAGSARNEGLKHANGQYISLIDGDDWISADLFEDACEALKQDPLDIFCFDYYEATEKQFVEKHTWLSEGYYDKSRMEKEIYPNLIRNINGKRVPPNLCFKIFARNLYEKFQNIVDSSIRIGEDECVCLPCVYNANNIYISHKCYYYYRQNNLSVTKARKEYPWTDIPLRVNTYRKYLPINEYDFENQINRLIVHELFNIALSYLRTDRPYKEAKKEIINNLNSEFYAEAIANCKYKNNIKEQLATFAVRYKKIFLIYVYAKIFR